MAVLNWQEFFSVVKTANSKLQQEPLFFRLAKRRRVSALRKQKTRALRVVMAVVAGAFAFLMKISIAARRKGMRGARRRRGKPRGCTDNKHRRRKQAVSTKISEFFGRDKMALLGLSVLFSGCSNCGDGGVWGRCLKVKFVWRNFELNLKLGM